jgi:hypothetical protein
MAKKKSTFYHLRLKRVCLNEERTAEVLGVSVEDVLRWDIEGAPLMAERLLFLWDKKNVGHEGWNGFYFTRGVLVYKKLRWRPEHLMKHQEYIELIGKLESEIIGLKSWRGMKFAIVKEIKKRLTRFL